MVTPNEPLSISILAIMYFGDVVFAISGALTAARYRMDILGFVLIGTITGIGGGAWGRRASSSVLENRNRTRIRKEETMNQALDIISEGKMLHVKAN